VTYPSRRDLLKAGLALSASSLLPPTSFASPLAVIADAPSQQDSAFKDETIVLSDGDWKLGSFSFS
jgi:hypothetical protein